MKRLGYENGPLDALDTLILKILTSDARTSMADLARAVGM